MDPGGRAVRPARFTRCRSRCRFACFGDFELVIWDRIMVARFGFPAIPISRWHNVQAACSHLALPRALGKVLPVLGADVVKDGAGRRLVLSLSRRNRRTGQYPDLTPEARQRVSEYNRIDVEGLMAIHAATGVLSGRERQVGSSIKQSMRAGSASTSSSSAPPNRSPKAPQSAATWVAVYAVVRIVVAAEQPARLPDSSSAAAIGAAASTRRRLSPGRRRVNDRRTSTMSSNGSGSSPPCGDVSRFYRGVMMAVGTMASSQLRGFTDIEPSIR